MASEWKLRGVKRRDERHTKDENIRPTSSNKKNTKKWCRGVVGREHKLACKDVDFYRFKNKVLACTECGKQVDWWSEPPLFWRSTRPKPDWVTD
jgi:hypothetical protein